MEHEYADQDAHHEGFVAFAAHAQSLERLEPDNFAPNQFGNLRHYGVSEASQSVHPVGNPMSHSTHFGFGTPPNRVGRSSSYLSRSLPLLRVLGPFQSVALGVGHDPCPLSDMGRAGMDSTHHERPRGVA